MKVINEQDILRFNQIMKVLLKETGASRTTLRLEDLEQNIELERIIAEATGEKIKSLKGSKSITNLRETVAPVQHMEKTLEILVQNDCLKDFPKPPKSLVEHYGVKAQMLGPIINDESLIGVISVHYNIKAREWSNNDIRALKTATRQVNEILNL